VPSGVVDPIEIAWIEFNSGAIPITVKRETYHAPTGAPSNVPQAMDSVPPLNQRFYRELYTHN
jgi:hypothetical protein